MEAPLTPQQLKNYIQEDTVSQLKRDARVGERYYEEKHDILDTTLFWIDNEGEAHIENQTSSVKIAHGFFTEQVDQKVQYLLSNPVEFLSEDEELQEAINDYIDEDFQVVLQEVVEGSSIKGKEYLYFYHVDTDEGRRVKFRVSDMLNSIEVLDDLGNPICFIRYYQVKVNSQTTNKTVFINKAEVWDSERVWFYVQPENQTEYALDTSVALNPRPHTIVQQEVLVDDDEQATPVLRGKGFGQIPFLKLDNSKKCRTDLAPVKALIDDYDLMASSLSDNLIDFDRPLYAVRGYKGDDLKSLIKNIKTKKTIRTTEDGGVDVQTVNIPVEARKVKLEIDKENIYKFGMAFDSTQLGDGNITNVVIKSRYSLLDLKCNKTEMRLKRLIRQMLEVIIKDINMLNNTSYKAKDIDIVITRATPVNETDIVTNARTEMETKRIALENIFSSVSRLDDETVLELICEVLELDKAEIDQRLGSQDYNVDSLTDNKVVMELLNAQKKGMLLEEVDQDE